jgi:uncharacterized membrane protein
MAHQTSAMRDQKAYARVGGTLLSGLLVSIAVMTAGLVASALRGSNGTSTVLPLDRVVPHLLDGEPKAILDVGILLLFATPLVAVLVAFGEFVAQRDIAFVLVTGLLLCMLVVAFAVALH